MAHLNTVLKQVVGFFKRHEFESLARIYLPGPLPLHGVCSVDLSRKPVAEHLPDQYIRDFLESLLQRPPLVGQSDTDGPGVLRTYRVYLGFVQMIEDGPRW